jgi:hypothetical protein
MMRVAELYASPEDGNPQPDENRRQFVCEWLTVP